MENNTNNNNKSILDILFDENNEDSIVLYDETGKQMKWDQIAVIPMEERLYVILKPLDEIPGIAEDEAVVFRVDGLTDDFVYGEMGDDCVFAVETDPEVADAVFEKYYAMLDKLDSQQEEGMIPPPIFVDEERYDPTEYFEQEEIEDSCETQERSDAFWESGFERVEPEEGELAFALHKDGRTCAVVGMGKCREQHIVIPETYRGKIVTEIAPDAFSEAQIESVTIPNSMRKIGSFAFDLCTKLTEIRINSDDLFFDASAFFRCRELKRVVFAGDARAWSGLLFSNVHAYPLSYGATLAFTPQSDA